MKVVKKPEIGMLVQVKSRPYEYCHRREWLYADAKIIEVTDTCVTCIDEKGHIYHKKPIGIYEPRNIQGMVDHFRKEIQNGVEYDNTIEETFKWYFENGFVK